MMDNPETNFFRGKLADRHGPRNGDTDEKLVESIRHRYMDFFKAIDDMNVLIDQSTPEFKLEIQHDKVDLSKGLWYALLKINNPDNEPYVVGLTLSRAGVNAYDKGKKLVENPTFYKQGDVWWLRCLLIEKVGDYIYNYYAK